MTALVLTRSNNRGYTYSRFCNICTKKTEQRNRKKRGSLELPFLRAQTRTSRPSSRCGYIIATAIQAVKILHQVVGKKPEHLFLCVRSPVRTLKQVRCSYGTPTQKKAVKTRLRRAMANGVGGSVSGSCSLLLGTEESISGQAFERRRPNGTDRKYPPV